VARHTSPSQSPLNSRLRVVGKSLYAGDEKFLVRGVTYGTFRPGPDGSEYNSATAKSDFALIAQNGFNAIRTYTVPPLWVLDLAGELGLKVMVGLPWEQHMAFLDDRRLSKRIEEGVARGVRACAGHPAVLCYALGNEIPTSIVRWHGHARIERFVKKLFDAAKTEDPSGLCTYASYPSTEYLHLPFLDFLCFNVYLESPGRLDAYISRLQNLAGDRPLLLGEIGLDSRRHGEEMQALVLESQVQAALDGGCAGGFVFSWTDEWYRGGFDVEDWDFGLTDRNRQPKRALNAVCGSFSRDPYRYLEQWPRISVVVCTFNGSRTLADCCEGLKKLLYPNFEVIVVNDGSTDATAEIAAGHGFPVITTENRGLSSARNTGIEAATGDIVAYTDDDARPDPHWLYHVASTLLRTNHVGVGGPNITPGGDGSIADCVANAPGGPMHVLIADTEAEHIPGCNMAFWKAALQQVGGFDVQFRAAGDDVDLCWRLQESGGTLGFNPGAVVLHRRRNSLRAYWKQQVGYGKAEALLERKWPGKYNGFGHLTWAGRLYGKGRVYSKGLVQFLLGSRGRIYQGTWGTAPYQFLDEAEPGTIGHLLLMPEWFLLLGLLSAFTALGLLWPPLLVAGPILLIGIIATIIHALMNAAHAVFPGPRRSRAEILKLKALTALLHLTQPVARLAGRLRYGLTPWRRRGDFGFLPRGNHAPTLWSELWRSGSDRVHAVEAWIRDEGLSVLRGGPYDRWDLEVWCGLLGGCRGLFVIEEHSRQLIRLRSTPTISVPSMLLGPLLLVLSVAAGINGAVWVAGILGTAFLFFVGRLVWECGVCRTALHHALQHHETLLSGKADGSPVQAKPAVMAKAVHNTASIL
jgi:glycosyltransferase involved in cell wall biosynthesis